LQQRRQDGASSATDPEEHDRRERSGRDHVAKHLDRIVAHHAHVREPRLAHLLEKASHTRRMDLDREVVGAGILGGDSRRRLAHSGAHFHHHGRMAAERPVEVHGLRLIGDSEARQELRIGALLPGRKPSLAKDIAADRGVILTVSVADGGAFLQQSAQVLAGLNGRKGHGKQWRFGDRSPSSAHLPRFRSWPAPTTMWVA
jgi:hypothetical protein